MGKFIGESRSYEGVTLHQLAEGLCTSAYLNQIENGHREAGKLLTDALLQRLGKSVDLFELILNWKEFQSWQMRQNISCSMAQGDYQRAGNLIDAYAPWAQEPLVKQFVLTARLNLKANNGGTPEELPPLIQSALELTHPDFQKESLSNILITEAEGWLLLRWLELREQTEGQAAVSQSYMDLYQGLYASRYDSRSRGYLMPHVACHVIDQLYNQNKFQAALAICDKALEELAVEKRLDGCDKLLKWRQLLFDKMGIGDNSPSIAQLRLKALQSAAEIPDKPFVPLEEHSHVIYLNQLICERRKLLNLSQEQLAAGICDPRTISRIETKNIVPQREIRRKLLNRLGLSGERYDYQIISEHYEDYILRSEYARACYSGEFVRASELLQRLRDSVPQTVTNQQYLMAEEAFLHTVSPERALNQLSPKQSHDIRKKALHLTLPVDLEHIQSWPVCSLSLNEAIILSNLARTALAADNVRLGLDIYEYLWHCASSFPPCQVLHDDFYLGVLYNYASFLGDLGHL